MRLLIRSVVAIAFVGLLAPGVAAGTTASAAPTAPTVPMTAPATTARELVFAEGFDGPQLDDDKWIPCYPWWAGEGCEHLVNNELQWYRPQQNRLAGSRLEMTAKPKRVLGEDEEGDPHWFDYVSGMVTTAGKFEFTYGYVEIEARVPDGQGLWPALWLLTAPCCAPEIDIMENLGQRPGKMYFTYHPDYRHQLGTSVRGVSRGWHTYAVDWQPDSVTWYLDGDEVFHVDQAPQEPMYLLMNLAVGGDWPGPPDDTTDFPATFDVRSVKIWQ
jgi:beta-glucanase (GH16 family)